MDSVISVEHLRKTYGATVAVDDVSFEVRAGEIFGLLGPNGAGKTTTVECLQGLRTYDAGEVRVLGLDPLRDARTLRGEIGSQLQESGLPDRIKVWEALDLFSSFTPHRMDWRELMERWGLAEKRNSAVGNLSGGQRQRLFIALALVTGPSLVFLDEMTAGLDPGARREAWDLIEAVRDAGTTVVLVTHFMDEAERLCDRIAVVHRGRIAAIDTAAGLVGTYAGDRRVLFSCAENDALDWLADIPGVRSVRRRAERVEVAGEGPLLALTAAALVSRGIVPADLRLQQGTLEDAFLAITGRTVDV